MSLSLQLLGIMVLVTSPVMLLFIGHNVPAEKFDYGTFEIKRRRM